MLDLRSRPCFDIYMLDEGPSEDDIRRFGDEGSDTALCSACGAEVWDQADVCPECGEFMIGGPDRRSPLTKSLQQRWVVVLVVLLIVALLGIASLVL